MLEDRTPARWGALGLAFAFAGIMACVVAVNMRPWQTGLFIYCIIAYGVYRTLRNLFSVSVLEATDTELALIRRLFFFKSERRFLRKDVEWIGYASEVNAYQNHQDAALLLLVRSDVTPTTFAPTITPEEATEVMDALKSRIPWIGPLIKPVGTHPF